MNLGPWKLMCCWPLWSTSSIPLYSKWNLIVFIRAPFLHIFNKMEVFLTWIFLLQYDICGQMVDIMLSFFLLICLYFGTKSTHSYYEILTGISLFGSHFWTFSCRFLLACCWIIILRQDSFIQCFFAYETAADFRKSLHLLTSKTLRGSC